MFKDLMIYIDSGKLDWVFWTLVICFLLIEAINWAHKKNEERELSQWVFAQWLAGTSSIIVPLPAYDFQQKEELRKTMKFEFKLLIFLLLPALFALVSVYLCRWKMGWSVPATIGIGYISLYVGIILVVLIIRALPDKVNA